jgi:Zn-dependent M28 family amino/carboxypeptidase
VTRTLRFAIAGVFSAAILAGCSIPAVDAGGAGSVSLAAPLESFTPDGFTPHIRVLASDEFGGRLPGTRGEELTVAYISDQFKALGLRPGNPDGSYVQAVPLVGFTGKPAATLQAGGSTMALKFPDDFVAFATHRQVDVAVENSDLVFVGYGVIAPEYGWDDYKGMDVRGKTLVMLINDPQIPDPKNPAALDAKMFKGKAMTYYGRWTYKYEIAAKLGAAAAIIVHETETARYPYEVVANSWSRENFSIRSDGPNPDFPKVASWIHVDRAKQLFAASGYDFDKLKQSALSRNFKPVALPAKANFRIQNSWREVASRNVVARIEGSDPKLKGEFVVYTAHWDHFGTDPSRPGTSPRDKIFHGAIDNASGISALLSLAKAFSKLAAPPKRSILFIATTAEEQGLLGAKYYAEHPLYPLSRTLANINIDGINAWGRTRDVSIVGSGNSTLDDMLADLAATQGRSVKDDPFPENGGFFRSDQFEFAKQGVPVMYMRSGNDFIGKPAGFGDEVEKQFIANDYHKPSDDIRADWDFSGAVEDARLLFLFGYRVAQSQAYPQWKPGAEFSRKGAPRQ